MASPAISPLYRSEQSTTALARKIALLTIGFIGLLAIAAGCSYCFGYAKHLGFSAKVILSTVGGGVVGVSLGVFAWDYYMSHRSLVGVHD